MEPEKQGLYPGWPIQPEFSPDPEVLDAVLEKHGEIWAEGIEEMLLKQFAYKRDVEWFDMMEAPHTDEEILDYSTDLFGELPAVVIVSDSYDPDITREALTVVRVLRGDFENKRWPVVAIYHWVGA